MCYSTILAKVIQLLQCKVFLPNAHGVVISIKLIRLVQGVSADNGRNASLGCDRNTRWLSRSSDLYFAAFSPMRLHKWLSTFQYAGFRARKCLPCRNSRHFQPATAGRRQKCVAILFHCLALQSFLCSVGINTTDATQKCGRFFKYFGILNPIRIDFMRVVNLASL